MHRQLILAASAILVGLASSQTGATLPSCANNCVTSLLPADCNLNPDCICHAESFLNNIGCCVFQACNAADQTAALNYAHSICDPVSASSLLPASATCTSSSSGTTGAAASASSVSGSLSSKASSASASMSSAMSSASASVSSAASSASSSASSAASAASASAASATASPTGAANQVGMGLGAMGAGVLGLAALL